MKMKIMKLPGFIVCLAFIFFSCENDKEASEQSVLAQGVKDACEITVELMAGQFTDVGEVTALLDGPTLTVTYIIDEPGWCISSTHLDVQLAPANFPMTKKGNPKIGHFVYSESLDCETYWEQEIELAILDGWQTGAQIFIAAHAEVEGEYGDETAWGEGPWQFNPNAGWAMYFDIDCP